MYQTGDKVRILPHAFPGSDEPADVAARGQVGQVGAFIEPDSDAECFEVILPDGLIMYVLAGEVEPAND